MTSSELSADRAAVRAVAIAIVAREAYIQAVTYYAQTEAHLRVANDTIDLARSAVGVANDNKANAYTAHNIADAGVTAAHTVYIDALRASDDHVINVARAAYIDAVVAANYADTAYNSAHANAKQAQDRYDTAIIDEDHAAFRVHQASVDKDTAATTAKDKAAKAVAAEAKAANKGGQLSP